MKGVSELLTKRLHKLEAPFSREWIVDFSSLMQFIRTNPLTLQILEKITKQKTEAHAPFIFDLNNLLQEGRNCLKEITLCSNEDHISGQIRSLLEFKINVKEIADPFFELESVYHKYYKDFASLLRTLAHNETNTFISKYCTLSCTKLQDIVDLNIHLTFSSYLLNCKGDAEILSGQRAASIWGKWDMLLKWAEWTKNGISPTNHAFEQNLSNLYRYLKISETIQSCGLFFLEQLAGMPAVTVDNERCIKALQLFLDQDDQYWIIVHFSGENSEKREFFIKKLQRESRAYSLLKLLLEAEPYSPIEFTKLSHTLGELEIKKDLKKVFFPHGKFAGSHVQLGEIDVDIDATAILKHLSLLQKDKKHRPSFNWGHYHRCSPALV